jgi:hypothetical protein
MALPVPFISGKDATFRLFINGKETILNAKSWSISADVTKAQDGVNGEDRDRPMSFVNLYNWTVTGFLDKMTVVDDILAYVANTDAQVAPYDVAFGIKAKIQDGTKKAYVGKEATLDDFTVNETDRKDRVMFTCNGRARYVDPVPTL